MTIRTFLITVLMAVLVFPPAEPLAQVGRSGREQTRECPDRFLKNAFSLMKRHKIAEALETFNDIVKNFIECPEAEEAEYQLVKYYSAEARRSGNRDYYTLADEHIAFYLAVWADGGYRASVLREREWNKRAQAPYRMSRGRFIALLTLAVASTLLLGLATK